MRQTFRNTGVASWGGGIKSISLHCYLSMEVCSGLVYSHNLKSSISTSSSRASFLRKTKRLP